MNSKLTVLFQSMLVISACTASIDQSLDEGVADAGNRESGQEGPISLVDASAWVVSDGASTPFESRYIELMACSEQDFYQELGGIEVDTGPCDNIILMQPLIHDLSAGDVLSISAWHSPLIAPGFVEVMGHMALSVGNEIIWDQEIPIPAAAQSYAFEATIHQRHELGELIYLQINNHGNNTWNFHSLTLESQ